jgi:hypothetical protein
LWHVLRARSRESHSRILLISRHRLPLHLIDAVRQRLRETLMALGIGEFLSACCTSRRNYSFVK